MSPIQNTREFSDCSRARRMVHILIFRKFVVANDSVCSGFALGGAGQVGEDVLEDAAGLVVFDLVEGVDAAL